MKYEECTNRRKNPVMFNASPSGSSSRMQPRMISDVDIIISLVERILIKVFSILIHLLVLHIIKHSNVFQGIEKHCITKYPNCVLNDKPTEAG